MLMKHFQQALNLENINETVSTYNQSNYFESFHVKTIEGNEYVIALSQNNTFRVVYKP